jgi:hypothetical protein
MERNVDMSTSFSCIGRENILVLTPAMPIKAKLKLCTYDVKFRKSWH